MGSAASVSASEVTEWVDSLLEKYGDKVVGRPVYQRHVISMIWTQLKDLEQFLSSQIAEVDAKIEAEKDTNNVQKLREEKRRFESKLASTKSCEYEHVVGLAAIVMSKTGTGDLDSVNSAPLRPVMCSIVSKVRECLDMTKAITAVMAPMPVLSADLFAKTLNGLVLAESLDSGDVPHHGCSAEHNKVVAYYVRAGVVGDISSDCPFAELHEVDRALLGIPADHDCNVAAQKLCEWITGTVQFMVTNPPSSPHWHTCAGIIKRLLGSTEFTKRGHAAFAKAYATLRSTGLKRLQELGASVEKEVFVGKNLKSLGELGREHWNKKLRMDVGLVEDASDESNHILGTELSASAKTDEQYIVCLALVAAAVNPYFQETLGQVFKGRVNGDVKPAPSKTAGRMYAKLMDDHKEEAPPRPACNVDTVRAAVVFDTAEDLMNGYKRVAARFKPLRVKNNFDPNFDAPSKSFGYRAILANLSWDVWSRHGNDDGKTKWTRHFQKAEQTWTRMGAQFTKLGISSEDVFKAKKTDLAALDSNKNEKERFVVEVQFILRDYMTLRQESHFWYKIVRSADAEGLANDCASASAVFALNPQRRIKAFEKLQKPSSKPKLHILAMAIANSVLNEQNAAIQERYADAFDLEGMEGMGGLAGMDAL